jgi:integrase
VNGRITKRGKSYQGIIYIGSEVVDGKRKPIRETFTCATREEAKAELLRRLTNQKREPGMLLRDYMDEWLANRRLSSNSIRQYRAIVTHHLGPAFGNTIVGDITDRQINDYLRKSTLSPKYLLNQYQLLNHMLSDAVDEGLLNRNPMRHVDKPRMEHKEYHLAGRKTMDLLLEKCEPMLYLPILLACTTGMRIGEICGLRWADIEGEFLVVRRQRIYGRYANLKTHAARRVIVLMDVTKEELEKRRGADSEQVVVNAPNTIEQHFRALCDTLSLKLRFHDLRHSHATMLASQGANPRTIQERLGHGSVSTTLSIYTHVIPHMQKDAVEGLNEQWTTS